MTTAPQVQTSIAHPPAATTQRKNPKSSVHVGVCRTNKGAKPWRAYATEDGRTKFLGTFTLESEAIAAREQFMHLHKKDTTPLPAPATPPMATAPATPPVAPPIAPAEHTIHVCRLAVYSPLEMTRQELVLDRMVRAELAAAKADGMAGAVVIYSDESGEVTGRETVKF